MQPIQYAFLPIHNTQKPHTGERKLWSFVMTQAHAKADIFLQFDCEVSKFSLSFENCCNALFSCLETALTSAFLLNFCELISVKKCECKTFAAGLRFAQVQI